MNTLSSPNLACHYCQHYSPEGRRGGHCQRLGAPVSGEWKACSLMIPSFSSSMELLAMHHQPKPIVSSDIETTPTQRVLAPAL